MFRYYYGFPTALIKRAAEIAGGYRQLFKARLLSAMDLGPYAHRDTEFEEAAFVESVVGSCGWTEGAEGPGEAAGEGPAAILFLGKVR